jgi:PAS domain S-box-containing protein
MSFGSSTEDLVLGRLSWKDMTPPEWRDITERAITQLKATGTLQPYEKEYFRSDGSRVPVLVGSAVFEEDQNEGVSFVLDLRELKRTEEALRRSEAYLAEAQRLSRTGCFGWDVSSNKIYWSQELYRIFEYDPRTEPTLKLAFDRIHPEDRRMVRKLVKRVSNWAKVGDTKGEGNDIDVCVQRLAEALRKGPLALGFEAPMFVPIPTDPKRLTAARSGEFGKGLPSRPFSARAGATSLVTRLVVVSYILTTLRPLVPEATATLDWRLPPVGPGRLMLFEAFITDQRKVTDTRHVEDARLAIAAFQRGMRDPANFQSSVEEAICLSLLEAMMLRTGWATDPAILSRPCLVVQAHASEHHP